jgi:hypothetical protein
MSAHAYTEEQLVEQPAIQLFKELGWTTVSALEETFGATGTWLRGTKGEVVLMSRLCAALERLNPALLIASNDTDNRIHAPLLLRALKPPPQSRPCG